MLCAPGTGPRARSAPDRSEGGLVPPPPPRQGRSPCAASPREPAGAACVCPAQHRLMAGWQVSWDVDVQSNGWKMIFHRSQLLVSHQTEELPANGAFLFPSGFGGERTRPPWRLPQICLRGRPPLPLTQDGLPERRAPHPGCRRGRNGRGLCCV